MTRQAILIGSPGPLGSDIFLKGVDVDITNFSSFLKSSIGGSWKEKEIANLYESPSKNFIELFQSIHADFLLVYFSGHGQHDLKESNIAINDSESLSVSDLISIIKAPKTLLIIDSCRKSCDEEYSSFLGPEYLSFESNFNQHDSSEKYQQIISESTDGIVIAYSCSVGETSNDSELGGSYTYSLLTSALQWHEIQNSSSILSIHHANELTQQNLKRLPQLTQNPKTITISEENKLSFPFAIRPKSI
jgi:hypothetical protein